MTLGDHPIDLIVGFVGLFGVMRLRVFAVFFALLASSSACSGGPSAEVRGPLASGAAAVSPSARAVVPVLVVGRGVEVRTEANAGRPLLVTLQGVRSWQGSGGWCVAVTYRVDNKGSQSAQWSAAVDHVATDGRISQPPAAMSCDVPGDVWPIVSVDLIGGSYRAGADTRSFEGAVKPSGRLMFREPMSTTPGAYLFDVTLP